MYCIIYKMKLMDVYKRYYENPNDKSQTLTFESLEEAEKFAEHLNQTKHYYQFKVKEIKHN